MATVTTVASVVSTAESDIQTIKNDLALAESVAATKLKTITDALEQHAAAHAAEVTAAQALISKAAPAAPAGATSAAAYVLTSQGWVQRTVVFLGKNWRYLAAAAAIGILIYAKGVLHL